MERRWCLMCVLVLLACNQSLFDSNPGDDKDGGPGGGDDGGGDNPDGSLPVSNCPAPCAGDAAADFGAEQGANDVWYYLRDLGSANGADYEELAFGSWEETDAWTNGSEAPAIVNCSGSVSDQCGGLDGFVLLVPGPGDERPALAFRAPETATYSISGAARIAEGGPEDVPVQVLFSRAGRHDAVALQTIRTSTTEVGISGLVPALEGDEITLSIDSDETIPPLGVRLFFTRIDDGADAFPASCQVAIRFDADAPLAEGCNGIEVTDLTDGIETPDPGPSSNGPGPSTRLGEARQFVEGQYLRIGGAPLDYSADFTIQFWAKVGEVAFGPGLFNDWNVDVKGGVAFFTDYDSDIVDFCYMAHGAEEIDTCDQTSLTRDQQWHFWRAVRAGGTYTLCIDGVEKVSAPIAAGLNMTSDEAPRVGRNVVYNPAYLIGSIDEVRVFSQALPCSTVP
jgi:hypothetical protein